MTVVQSSQMVLASSKADEILNYHFNNEITGEFPETITKNGSGGFEVAEEPSETDKAVFVRTSTAGTAAGAKFDFDAMTDKVTLLARVKSSANSALRVYAGDDKKLAAYITFKSGYVYRNESGGIKTALCSRTDDWCWVEMVIDPAQKTHTVNIKSSSAAASMSEAKTFGFRKDVTATDIGYIEFQDLSGNGIYVDNVFMVKGEGKRVEELQWTEGSLIELEAGETHQLGAALVPEDALCDYIFYHSSNESVVTVSADGLLTAVANGRAKITVTTMDGAITKEVLVVVGDGGVVIDDTKVECVVNDEFLSADELSSYTVTENGEGAAVEITPVPHESDSSVRIVSSGNGEEAGIVRNFTPQRGIVVMETRIMRDLVDGQAVAPYIYGSNGKPIVSILIEGKDFKRYAGAELGKLAKHTGIAKGFWYNLKVLLDTQSKVYDVYIDDRLMESNIPFRNDCSDAASVKFSISGVNSGSIYADYLKVYAEKTTDDILYRTVQTEDFSGENAEGWTFTLGEEGRTDLFAGIRNGMAVIDKDVTGAGGESKITKTFENPIAGNAVIEYDVKAVWNSGTSAVNPGYFYDSNGRKIADFRFTNQWKIAVNTTAATGDQAVGEYGNNTNYHVKYEFDFDNQTYKITVTNKDANQTVIDNKEYPMRAGSAAKDLARIDFTITNGYSAELDIDNFSVSVPGPAFLAAMLENGTNLRNLTNVSYNTKSINVEFEDVMKLSSLEDSIMIKNMKTGEPVAYSGKLDESGKVYTLTLCEEVFEKGTKYVLTIPESCVSQNGAAIGNPENIMFFTEKEDIKVETLKFITKDTKEDISEHYGDLKEFNAFAQISNYNTSYSAATLIIAVYDEHNKMISCKTTDNVLSEYGDVVELELGVTLPDDGADYKVNAYVWYGTDNMKPIVTGYASINK